MTTTRAEIYLPANLFPLDSPIREAAREVGLAKSGFIRPRFYFRDGRIDYDVLYEHFDLLDLELESWVPLCLDFEHLSWFLYDNGPIPPIAYRNLKKEAADNMKIRYQRLCTSWGDPAPITPEAAQSCEDFTCAGLSIYWKQGQSTGEWKYNAKVRMRYASPIIAAQGTATMYYLSPTFFPKDWRDPGKPLNNGQWKHVLNFCLELKEVNPEAMFSFWQNRASTRAGFTDDFLIDRVTDFATTLEVGD